MARPSIVTVVFWGSMTAALVLTLVLPSQGATLTVAIVAPLTIVLVAIVLTLVLGRRAAKARGIDGASSAGTLWSPAPRHLYTITVLVAAVTWMMVGMHLGAAVEVWDAGGTPERLDLFLTALWLLMGLADVAWLLRSRPASISPGATASAPAI